MWTGDGSGGPADLFGGGAVKSVDHAPRTPEQVTADLFKLESMRERAELRQAERQRRERAEQAANRADHWASLASVGAFTPRTAAEVLADYDALSAAEDSRQAAEERRRGLDMERHAARQEDALAMATSEAIRARQLAVDLAARALPSAARRRRPRPPRARRS